MRKLIQGIICGTMILTLAAPVGMISNPVTGVSVYAQEQKNISTGKCGDNVIYTYDKDTKTVTVSGSGEMWDDIKLSSALKGAEHIVIENGVTSIGSFSFDYLYEAKSVKIADSVKTIKKYALGDIEGEVEIPASVTKVEEYAIGAKKIIVKGDLKGYEYCAFGGLYTDEIVLYGSAEDLGKASVNCGGEGLTVTIAQENSKCTLKNGCILSKNGKTLYYYISNNSKVVIPDSVETICDCAFFGMDISEVTLGKKVKEIGISAFEYANLQKVNFNKALKKIGDRAFNNTELKKVSLKGKVAIGNDVFSTSAVITNKKGIKQSQTTITNSVVDNNKYNITFSKVTDAKGYQVNIKAGKKTYKYFTATNSYKKGVVKAVTKYYNTLDSDEEKMDMKTAVTVTVRPYKIVKGKKVYGKWSKKSVVVWE